MNHKLITTCKLQRTLHLHYKAIHGMTVDSLQSYTFSQQLII